MKASTLNKTILLVPQSMTNQIIDSIQRGYHNLNEGLIRKNKRGIALCNDESYVRGTYPLELREYIEHLISIHKSQHSI